MLDIVVNSLYQNKDVFLRELISNASDALDKVRFIALTKPEYMEGKPELEVRIEYDEEAKTLTVRDSGIGMTHDDLVKNLGTVARSGTTKFIEAMGEGSADMGMIGQFGVGFYSTFLIADRVSVASKHPESDEQYIWESSNGESSFFVGKDPRGNTLGRGTEITLHLKEDAEEYAAGDRVRNLAKYYSEFVTHPIHLRTSKMTEVEIEDEESEESEAEEKKEEGEEGEEKEEKDDLEIDEEEDAEEEKPKKTKEVLTHSWEEVNSEQAIWTRSKDEITDEEYNGFWKNVNKNANSDAASWIHFNAEGNINFKSLLYLPSDVPQSLMQGNFDTERKGGLKLYVRKVLISDEFELMPKYLSFIKGVVDSDDLPLNVNRETLQESKIIKVISKKLVRKALEMLRKLADKDKAPAKKEEDEEKEVELDDEGNIVETVEDEDDEEDEIDRPKPYLEWYKKFAPSLKMGVIEDEANRGKLAKLLRFKSSKTEGEDEYISLPEYIERMKDWQDDVYVFAGQNIDELEKSHFMEQFLEKDVEVLYLTDPVDEYMTQAMRDFEGKKFTAISKEGIKFKDEDEDMVKRREKAYKKKFKPLTKWLNKLYGPNVMRVSISKRLGKAPAIVSSAEYGHSANMERIMRAQAFQHGQDEMMMRAMRVLEINPRHPFIEKLLEGIPAGEDAAEDYQAEENTMDAAWLLYDMALMNGGFPISDAKEYSARMMKVLKMVMDVDELTLSEEISPAEEEDEPPEVDMDGNEGINLEDFNLDDFSDEFEGADI
mmetsp:Transcript_43889/g.133677  ORF Transcript_43889/g.133677 Transcript_43889/m.133677 type:complete len:772 (+) Transcript_43889:472-2787(+)